VNQKPLYFKVIRESSYKMCYHWVYGLALRVRVRLPCLTSKRQGFLKEPLISFCTEAPPPQPSFVQSKNLLRNSMPVGLLVRTSLWEEDQVETWWYSRLPWLSHAMFVDFPASQMHFQLSFFQSILLQRLWSKIPLKKKDRRSQLTLRETES